MRLVRFGVPGAEKPGAIDGEGLLRDLSDVISDISAVTMASGEVSRLDKLSLADLPLVRGSPRLGPPVTGVGKIVCVGLNYYDHALESNMEVPDQPLLFTKSPGAITGPTDPVIIPKNGCKTDWEVELVAVIGKCASYLEPEQVGSHIAGFCLGNDLSERAFQLEGSGQWVKGKSCDSFAPIGPWLVNGEDLPAIDDLDLWLEVEGHRYQNANTHDMMFKVSEIISYISQYMSLLPGDLVFTGTPPGVGLGQNPQVWLKAGDTLRCGITGLGEQEQTVINWEAG
ncbi:MAG: fumarylacetoacetate hydrolase family protein [Proteobacteria bacterium]|nr:fumarylacetoacetate hydrolase family protein [Pseudomonadota bacterium]